MVLNGNKTQGLVILFITHFLCVTAFGQDTTLSHDRLMFYNVENLFDASDDSMTDDREFLPGGAKGWSLSKYKRKTEGLYKTIMAAGEWDPPIVVGLCEVENRSVLESLVYVTGLSKYGYRIIHEESPDKRGIDVCMIYRPDRLTILNFHYWMPAGMTRSEFTSRSVLYCRFILRSDTINLLLNHWPSRRGGVLAAGKLRHSIASMVKSKADSLLKVNENAKIIIAGDFNSTPGDPVMDVLSQNGHNSFSLLNLSAMKELKNAGTYKYQGTWETIDQVLVSKSMYSSEKGVYADSASLYIFNRPFLLVNDEKYSGKKPYSTYSGYTYNGGFSDHLPVLLDLRFRERK